MSALANQRIRTVESIEYKTVALGNDQGPTQPRILADVTALEGRQLRGNGRLRSRNTDSIKYGAEPGCADCVAVVLENNRVCAESRMIGLETVAF